MEEIDRLNAKMTADLDQVAAGTRPLAMIMAAYHRSLVEAGLTRDEALVVVCEYQEWLLTRGGAS